MALNVSAWSIRKPLPAVVASAIFVILGIMSFFALPITRLPGVDVPVVSIAIAQFGAAPAELNDQVTKPVEDAVSGITGVRHVSSNITDGLSITIVKFDLKADPDKALNAVKDALVRVRYRLPQNITEPVVTRPAAVYLPTLTYTAASRTKTPADLSYFVDEVVKSAIQVVHGVGEVERIGGVDQEIAVTLDPERVQALGLTAASVSQQLRGTKVDVAGGGAEIGGRNQVIRTIAAASTLDEIRASIIILPSGAQVRLDDIGTVTDSVADPKTFARLDGKSVVGFTVFRAKTASDVAVKSAVDAKVKEIHAAHPDIDIALIDSSVVVTVGNYDEAIRTLELGAVLATIVVLLFLRDWRATLIAAVSLPLSILPAFWAMELVGFSLNLISFMAITLSTGILVDDAIVEIENIERHMAMGKTPYDAAMDAADEIGPAVIAISLTIIAVFVPVSFMSSVAGQFFKQFGITISVQVFFSLLAARFVTPVLAAYFLKPRAHLLEKPHGAVMRGYARVLGLSVRHYQLAVLLGIVMIVGAGSSFLFVPQGLLPPQDSARSILSVELPPGSTLAATETVTEEITRRLRKLPEVESVFVDGGRIPSKSSEVRLASITINYLQRDERKTTQHDLELRIGRDLESIPDIRSWFVDDFLLSRGIQLVVKGKNEATVRSVAAELATQMRRLSTIYNVVSSASLDRPELRIRPKPELAARLGLTTVAMADAIRIATIGDFEPALAKMAEGNRQIPIRVELEETIRADMQRLQDLRVPLPDNRGAVPLGSVADVVLEEGPSNIMREDRQLQAPVAADLAGDAALSQAKAEIDKLPIMKDKPRGVEISAGGDAESMQELVPDFINAATLGLLLVSIVLILLFGGVFQPVTILFALPLSIGGAITSLLLLHRPLSIPVYIGILMLMGIVTKNSIMLVDFTIRATKHGTARADAAMDAGLMRARPIVMTTIAMVAGMIPSAVGSGTGGEIRSPMAITVIGGLIASTVLSLVFIPAMYLLMDDLSRFSKRLLSPLVTSRNPVPDATHGAGHGASHPPTGLALPEPRSS